MKTEDPRLPYGQSDAAILARLGRFVQQTRLQQNRTQQAVAEAAGINRSTLVQLENGKGGTLLTFIQVMRALEQFDLFATFEVTPMVSPLQVAEAEQKKRRRARRSKADPPQWDWS